MFAYFKIPKHLSMYGSPRSDFTDTSELADLLRFVILDLAESKIDFADDIDLAVPLLSDWSDLEDGLLVEDAFEAAVDSWLLSEVAERRSDLAESKAADFLDLADSGLSLSSWSDSSSKSLSRSSSLSGSASSIFHTRAVLSSEPKTHTKNHDSIISAQSCNYFTVFVARPTADQKTVVGWHC